MARGRISKLSWALLAAGFLFLYAPMVILVIYSFNESRLVTVWAGFSTKWYVSLFENRQMMAAVWRSLQIAFLTATAAVVSAAVAARATPSTDTTSTVESAVTVMRGFARRLRALRAPWSQENQYVSSGIHTPHTGMACGRPSALAVTTQWLREPTRRSRAHAHGSAPSASRR